MSNDSPDTACVLLIGNEIRSGKTQDKNLQFLGSELARRGVRLSEARVLPDDKTEIVVALNECRDRYTYVFTTGGKAIFWYSNVETADGGKPPMKEVSRRGLAGVALAIHMGQDQPRIPRALATALHLDLRPPANSLRSTV